MKNKVKENEKMSICNLKELVGLLIEYKYGLRGQFKNSNNPSFKDEIMTKIHNVNEVLVDLGMPTYNEQYLKVQNETNN